MKIGFVTAYSSKHPAGLERCTLDLLKATLAQDSVNQYYVYTKKGSGLSEVLSPYQNVRVVEVGFGKLWKDLGLFFAPRADVYVFNGPQVPLFFAPRRYAVIAYDFGYREFFASGIRSYVKRLFLDALARLAFRRSQHILAISQHTKDEIVRLFSVSEEKIHVMHLGFEDICALPKESVTGVPEKFFLFVGTLKERKNPLNVVKAFAAFCKTHPNYALVLAGKPSSETAYHGKMLSVIHQEQLEGKVLFLGRVSDGELAWLYSRAVALVYPSFIEGFGFPILEAASCGAPVITSNQSSLEEIVGDAGLLVDPASVDSITQAMRRVAEDALLRHNLIQNGKARLSQFSWAKTAQQFTGVLRTYVLG